MTGTFNPEALMVARESRGRSQDEVGRAAGDLSQGAISKIENAVFAPAPDVVDRIAAFLGFPAEFFYESGPLREGKSGCLYHRKRKTVPAKKLNAINATMAVRLINTRRLLNGLEVASERQFHAMDPDEYGSPEAVAAALRTAWRIADGPIRDLVALIESAGGIVLMTSFGTHKLFGMSQWTTRDLPLFFLNSDSAMEELRWTIAHELGHLTMHATPTSDDLEGQADAFAGEFLAPRRLLLPDLRRLEFARLPTLKMHWRISMKALIKRAEVLGAIERDQAVRLYKQYSARHYNNAEPFPLPIEQPTLIGQAARVHLDDHGYTPKQLATAVRLLPNELADLLGTKAQTSRLSVVP